MNAKRYDLIVVGAGPAGLSAAIEAASCGMNVMVFDENARPGGQLFKQIHKFFGSKEHKAKTRGFRIGEELLNQARKLGVEVSLNTTVLGLYQRKGVSVMRNGGVEQFKGNAIILATGASENMLPFDGWTLPGVMGAGAAQTMMNLHGVQPGTDILMVGTGNVGLVVSYQLMQAGCIVKALIDAAPRVGGYGVHASKLTRTGIPFYLSHTVVKAEGTDHVTGVIIAEADRDFSPIPGTEKHFDVDTVCLAVGLSPMSQLARMAGCDMTEKGGAVPMCDELGKTSVPGIFAAGDVAGIEEASSAMIQGRLAAAAAARENEFITEAVFQKKAAAQKEALTQIRSGMFAPSNKGKTDMTHTDEGYPLSLSLLQKGYVTSEEWEQFKGLQTHKKGIHPVIECTQNIPCNPCQDVCPCGCIDVGSEITRLPSLNEEKECIGCGRCVANCPGQAIFLVEEPEDGNWSDITIPYEFLPVPQKGEKGNALSRKGEILCQAEVTAVTSAAANDHTNLITMRVPRQWSSEARFFSKRTGGAIGEQFTNCSKAGESI